MAQAFRLLRDALRQLSLAADAQRRELRGMVVTDELALDLANAVESLEYAQESAGVRLDGDLVVDLQRWQTLLDAERGDDLWADSSLDSHPTWAKARRLATELLARLQRP